jgi:thiamine biosynthesis lipoprotein ApbE
MSLSYAGALKGFAVGTAFVAAVTVALPRPVQADTTSTALFAVGAAAIVGALLYDSNNRPYYVNNNRRYYVTQNEASYYRSHHRVVQRQAWVPENEYPVQRNAGYNFQNRDQGR